MPPQIRSEDQGMSRNAVLDWLKHGEEVAAKRLTPPASLGQNITERIILDENIRAVVGKTLQRNFALGCAGVYTVKISRVSAFTAHCAGAITVVSLDTCKVLWRIDYWRSDKGGFQATFAIAVSGSCNMCLSMEAH